MVMSCSTASLLFVFGLAASNIYTAGKLVPLPAGLACPALNVSVHPHFAFTHSFKFFPRVNWHRTYVGHTSQGAVGHFEQRCPSLQHDSQLVLNGVVAGRSQGPLFSFFTQVLDCHGDVVFTWGSRSPLSADYEIRVGDEHGHVVAFADTTWMLRELTDEISISSAADGSRVANMYRNKLSLSPWSWKFAVHNATHPAANALLLTMLTGKLSFPRFSTDHCNAVFFSLAFVMFVAAAVLSCVLLYFGLAVVYTCCCGGGGGDGGGGRRGRRRPRQHPQ
jgi:hypothetical protein